MTAATTTILRRERVPADLETWARGLRAPEPTAAVGPILDAVRSGGDAALLALTRRFDGAELASVWLEADEVAAGAEAAPVELRAALAESHRAVLRYHADQRALLATQRRVRTGPGVLAWRRWQPIRRAGGYVPGGRAAYASSVIMLGVPARLAGVEELVLATPPNRDGAVSPAILAAAALVGVRRILLVGGAQAIAALAFGTETVPRVDRIFGAGNAWVTAAKRAVSAEVAIDLPAGPSECVVLADGGADPELIAWDLLAQAEHGPDSLAICVTDTEAMLDAVEVALPRLAATIATGDRALATLAEWGRAVVVDVIDDAIGVIDAIGPEHVSVQTRDAASLGARIRSAGAIFIGPWSAVAAGDYATGTNHILPTGGAARAVAGVGVEAVGRWIEVQELTATGAARIAATVETIAAAEGLPAHAASVVARRDRAAGLATAGDDPVTLLRQPGPVSAYPAEASDEAIAAELGIDVAQVARLDMNTLGGGPLPAVAAVAATLDGSRLTKYGDLAYARLRAALARHAGCAPRQIVPGAGADELIRLVTTATIGAGDAVVIPTPTFGMFAVEAGLAGGRVVAVPRQRPNRRQSVGELRTAVDEHGARLLWLCSPNNPTGDLIPIDEIAAIADGLSAIVCVDEVYLEFAATASAVELQSRHPNVLVLRSLSKAYGLAGARVGYLVVPPELAERFDAIRLPLSVSAVAERLAIAALADEGAAADRRASMVVEAARLARELSGLGFEVLPSVANFVAARPPAGSQDALAIDRALGAAGIVVRRYDSGPMDGWLRITARTAPETDRLLGALGAILVADR